MRQRWPVPKLLALMLSLALAVYFGGRWLVSIYYPLTYREQIFMRAQQSGLDPYLVAAVIRRESKFQSDAISQQGALGLMQVMPETGAWVAGKLGLEYSDALLFDPAYNIQVGTWYLDYLHDQFDGNTAAALAAYNGGENNVRDWLRERKWNGMRQTINQVPFSETREYVKGVLTDQSLYVKIYQR